MQIEAGFRDLKSTKFGFGLEHMRSRGVLRLSNFILVTTLAQVIACLIGVFAEKNNWHRYFQISSNRAKRILSLFFLGCQVIKRKLREVPLEAINNYMKDLQLYAPT